MMLKQILNRVVNWLGIRGILILSVLTFAYLSLVVLFLYEGYHTNIDIYAIIIILSIPLAVILIRIAYLIYNLLKKESGSKITIKLTMYIILLTMIPSIILLFTTSSFLEKVYMQSNPVNLQNDINNVIELFDSSIREKARSWKVKYYMKKIVEYYNWSHLITNSKDVPRKKWLSIKNYSNKKLDFFMVSELTTQLILRQSFISKEAPQVSIDDYINFLLSFDKDMINELGESQIDWLTKDKQIVFFIIADINYIYFGGKFISESEVLINKNLEQIAKTYAETVEVGKPQLEGLQVFIALITFPVILIAIIVSFFITRNITLPIAYLVEGTMKVASGDLTHRIPHEAGDELGLLIRSFNRMTIELRRNRNRLYQAEKIAAWREVAKRLAHEVKNPLTPVKLSAERIKRQFKNNNPNIEEIIETCTTTISSEVDRLKALINEFSEFARFPKINKREMNIDTFFKEIIDSYRQSYSHICIYLKMKSLESETDKRVQFDNKQFKQVIVNLINNAIDALNKPNGKIEVEINKIFEDGKYWCRIEISDNGMGISEEGQRQLFTPYYSTKQNGTGLGLVIVKNIIEEHGGSINFESIKGEGTTFTIDLPY